MHPCVISSVFLFPTQREPDPAKADVVRSTTVKMSATATPSAPSTTTAAATTQTSVTVRPLTFVACSRPRLIVYHHCLSASFYLSERPVYLWQLLTFTR